MTNTAVTDLLSDLSPKQLDQLKKLLNVRADEEENAPKDEPLKEPVYFTSVDRPWLKFVLPSGRKCKFINGEFVAKTSMERDFLRERRVEVFEGRDMKEPLIDEATRRRFWNSKAYERHVKRNRIAA